MVLLLCGLAGFAFSQLVKLISPLAPRPLTMYLWVIVASMGTAAGIYYHDPIRLVVYGAAGTGLAVVVDAVARLLNNVANWVGTFLPAPRPRDGFPRRSI